MMFRARGEKKEKNRALEEEQRGEKKSEEEEREREGSYSKSLSSGNQINGLPLAFSHYSRAVPPRSVHLRSASHIWLRISIRPLRNRFMLRSYIYISAELS